MAGSRLHSPSSRSPVSLRLTRRPSAAASSWRTIPRASRPRTFRYKPPSPKVYARVFPSRSPPGIRPIHATIVFKRQVSFAQQPGIQIHAAPERAEAVIRQHERAVSASTYSSALFRALDPYRDRAAQSRPGCPWNICCTRSVVSNTHATTPRRVRSQRAEEHVLPLLLDEFRLAQKGIL
jgi:hypothetical protein